MRMRAVAVVVVVLAATACGAKPAAGPGPSASAAPSGSPVPSQTLPPLPTIAPSPSPPGSSSPSPTPSHGQFIPDSVTFVSAKTGWVLGGACSTCPTSLLQTRDGGATWASAPAPPESATGGQVSPIVRFANLQDGWVLSADLWATHDGGAHWTKQSLPGFAGQVQDVEAAGGTVHAVGIQFDPSSIGFVIESSPVHTDGWQPSPTRLPVGGGPVPGARIVLAGSTGWIVQNDRVVINGARLVNGAWAGWNPACSQVGGPARLAASSPTDVVAVCDEGMFGGAPLGIRAHLSSDGGTSFVTARADLPLSTIGGVATPAAGVIFAAGGSKQAALDSIVVSRDGGQSWATVYRGALNGYLSELGFTTSTQGVAITGSADLSAGTLLMTRDGGRTWHPVPLPPL